MSRGLAILVACLSLALAPQAFAAEEKKAEGAPNDADLRLDLSGIGLPILRDGKVINFFFIREGLVRAAYRTPLNTGTEYMAVDPKKFEAALMKEARAALGTNRVRSVELRDQKAQKRIYVPPAQASGGRAIIPP